MKTQSTQNNNPIASEPNAKKQAPAGSILQAYKWGTDQLAAAEEGSLQQKENKATPPLVSGDISNTSSTVQRRQVHEATDYGTLGISNTNETFSVVGEAQYSKDGAGWYADNTVHAAANKNEAMGKIAKRAGDIGTATKALGKKERLKKPVVAGHASGIFAKQAYYNRSDVNAIDPFTHGSFCQIGEDKYLVLMYQHTHDLDGYVNGVEEGDIEEGGTFARTFAENMQNGDNKATASVADVDETYSHQHDKTGGRRLSALAASEEDGKADAITKLAGEGARFEWVRSQIATITDDTLYPAPSRDGKPDLSIRFGDLWCVWKDWFDGAYNIKNSEIDSKLYAKADAGRISKEAKKRIRFNNMKYADYIKS